MLPGRAKPRRVGTAAADPARAVAIRGPRTYLGLSAAKALTLAFTVIALALTMALPIRNYFGQQADLRAAAAEHEELQRQVDDLQAMKDRTQDPKYIETQARERLRFVKPGDKAYQVQLPGDWQPPVSEEAVTKHADGPWYTQLWDSLKEAPVTAAPEPAPAPVPAEGQHP